MAKKGDCPSCGLPRRLADELDWREGGNVFTRFKPRRQVVFMEHLEVQALMQQALEQGEDELMRRLLNARRRYLRHRTFQQAEGAGSRLLRNRRLGRRAVLYALREAGLFGLGCLEVGELVAGERLEMKMEHPYHPRLLAADICGFWEGLFRVEAKDSLEQRGPRSWSLRLESGGSLPVRAMEYRDLLEREAGKREREIERCPACGLPALLSRLRWDASKGTIYDPERNRYFVIMEVAGLNSLLKEIRSFLGKGYPAAAYRAFAASLGDGGGDAAGSDPREIMGEWPSMGWGKAVSVSSRPFLEEVEMRNPALPSLAEQKLAAAYRLLWGEEVDAASARAEDGRFLIRLGPRITDYSMNLETLRGRFPQLIHHPLSFFPF